MKKIYRFFLIIILFFISFIIYREIEEEYESSKGINQSVLSDNGLFNGKEYASSGGMKDTQLNNPESSNTNTQDKVKLVIPSGEPIGIYVKTEGVMVIGVTEIKNQSGVKESPCQGLFMPGDYIVGVNGEKIKDKNELTSIIEGSHGKALYMDVIRNNENITVTVTPVKSQGKYMLGLWVKDDISGIGTMTYIDEDGFAALGHSINDNDTGTVMSIADGAIYETTLINIVKSNGEVPGRLEGIIDYSKENIMGRVVENHQYGIRGYMTENGVDTLAYGEWIPVAKKEEASIGEGYILSCVSGKPVFYKIEITSVDISSSAGNKGLEIKIVDERLLDMTNGIVQGMSGTPIIQNGKLLGAITHVFVKDSTRGYGTFVENMME
ncbi:MAG: SpoIVB peptidase [Lachnospiraceae bacterium]|nr:SpoIVB peptidase [Lachnospiraceae bacterium]